MQDKRFWYGLALAMVVGLFIGIVGSEVSNFLTNRMQVTQHQQDQAQAFKTFSETFYNIAHSGGI